MPENVTTYKNKHMTMLEHIEIDSHLFLNERCSLPPLPRVVAEIQEIIYSEDIDIDEVVKLIETDPAMLAQILKIVNSSYYGFRREIFDIKFTVAYLGVRDVFRIILSLAVINTIGSHEKEELNRFWFHSFYTALCSKYIAERVEPLLLSDELWPAAILHDIGKLIYFKFFPRHYNTLNQYCLENGCLFNDAEHYYNLPASAYIGSLLCDYWKLPDKIKIACSCHTLNDLKHVQMNAVSDSFKRIICLGNLFAILSADALNDRVKNDIAISLRENMSVSEPEFLEIMGEIHDLKIEVETLGT